MAIQPDLAPPSQEKPTISEVILIPWDPDSPEHAERLRLQRVACGWSRDQVERWRIQQREGTKALHWIVSRMLFSSYTRSTGL